MKDYKTYNGPYIKTPDSVNKIMLRLLISLTPIILFAFYKNGIVPYQKGYLTEYGLVYPLLFILIPTITSYISELIINLIINCFKKDKKSFKYYLKQLHPIFPGLFIGLVLPYNTPIYLLVGAALIATILGKIIFGGFGKNIFNPALLGCIIIMYFFSSTISGMGGYFNSYELDTISSATPLSNAKVNGYYSTYDKMISNYGDLSDFATGTIPGSLGETSSILILCAFIYLALTKSIKSHITISYVGTVFILTFILGMINGMPLWFPIFHILSGGLLFGATFMATDPVTSPIGTRGGIIYGILLGILTTIIRFTSSYPEGVMISIIILNIFVPLIDKLDMMLNNKKILVLIPIIIMIIGLIYLFIPRSNTKDEVTIISRDVNNKQITYVATSQGNDDIIKAKIVIDNGIVKSYEILEIKDEYYSVVKNNKYIDKLINGQNNIEKVDTVSGATITSNAMKKILEYTINDYNNSKLGVKVGDKEIEVKETKNYEIIDKKISNGVTTYIAKTNSLQANIIIIINIKDNKITNMWFGNLNEYPVYDQTDLEYLKIVINAKYLETLIKNQNNIDNVDTISGATISSKNIKETVKDILKEHISAN
jgi:electron transport complex protein RnfD